MQDPKPNNNTPSNNTPSNNTPSNNTPSNNTRSNRIPGILGLIVVIAIIAFTRLGGGDASTTQETVSAQESISTSQESESQDTDSTSAEDAVADAVVDAAPDDPPSVGPVSGLSVVLWAELPPEAQETIGLIDQGGPFPYDKDGSTFGNREELLPDRPQGYYKEYTVITPGSSDRGARRIVGGADDELYYTEDHYDSFREVIRE